MTTPDLLPYPKDTKSIPKYLDTNFRRIIDALKAYSSGSHTHPSEDWHSIGATGEPSFLNGYSNFTANAQYPAQFYKDAFGIVRCRGMLNIGTVPGDVFQFPVGYRPSVSPAGSGTYRWVDVNGVKLTVNSGGFLYIPGFLTGSPTTMDLAPIQFKAEA